MYLKSSDCTLLSVWFWFLNIISPSAFAPPSHYHSLPTTSPPPHRTHSPNLQLLLVLIYICVCVLQGSDRLCGRRRQGWGRKGKGRGERGRGTLPLPFPFRVFSPPPPLFAPTTQANYLRYMTENWHAFYRDVAEEFFRSAHKSTLLHKEYVLYQSTEAKISSWTEDLHASVTSFVTSRLLSQHRGKDCSLVWQIIWKQEKHNHTGNWTTSIAFPLWEKFPSRDSSRYLGHEGSSFEVASPHSLRSQWWDLRTVCGLKHYRR